MGIFDITFIAIVVQHYKTYFEIDSTLKQHPHFNCDIDPKSNTLKSRLDSASSYPWTTKISFNYIEHVHVLYKIHLCLISDYDLYLINEWIKF